MLAKRIIPCLDVRDGRVVKGIKFKNHHYAGEITDLAAWYRDEGADELVFYDITASSEERTVDTRWIERVSGILNVPFCVAGGIDSCEKARMIFDSGADKISINTPALKNPDLINQLSQEFGSQSIVVGVDSFFENGDYFTWMLTGDVTKAKESGKKTTDWIKEIQERGAGEIVLNCMNSDGMKNGYDIDQLQMVKKLCQVPLIASGGAGCARHFRDLFFQADVEGALAASIFHSQKVKIPDLKNYLNNQIPPITVRECYA